MEAIRAVLFEPVGCLAEFAPDEFNTAARELLAVIPDAATTANAVTGSQAYWRFVELLEPRYAGLTATQAARFSELEVAAVDRAQLYEDVSPSLAELRSTGISAYLVSSLSRAAVDCFLNRFSIADLFADSVSREDANGVMAQPLRRANDRAAIDATRTIYLVDTVAALEMSKQQGMNTLLMINDYDEGRALAERNPAGGIVSLAELVDALWLVDQRSGLRSMARLPHKPFELFDPG